jgi:predicted aldo/keto reductase-like oxidoreductase
MQYSLDPKSGNKLSVLGFGCMRFPRDYPKTENLILTAIENGVNYFDTAYVYLGSEATLGKILHKNNVRDKIYLATKLPYQRCKAPEDFEKYFQTQLEHLKTDHIDYYLIHNIAEASAWRALIDLGIEAWIADKKKSGIIRQIGFSFHGPQSGFMELLEAYDWDFCQIQYNYSDENYQAGRAGLQKAHEKGLPVIIMEPLLGGKLATGLPPKAAKVFEDADADRTPASWGFRWLWDQPEVTVVLSGMNADEQLYDNLMTADEAKPGMLTDAEKAVYAPVIEALRETYKGPCTGCNYCMPCPNNVNIPGCFSAYNTSYAMGFFAGISQYFNGTGAHRKKDYRPTHCTACGACEKKCPQHIEIPKSLRDVKKRMEPFWFGPIVWIVKKVMG